jgi:hypothetical protein
MTVDIRVDGGKSISRVQSNVSGVHSGLPFTV